MMGYTRKLRGLPGRVRFQVNVNNLLDDQKIVGSNTTTLFVDPSTGALVASTNPVASKLVVPNRAVRYFEPRTFRLSLSTNF